MFLTISLNEYVELGYIYLSNTHYSTVSRFIELDAHTEHNTSTRPKTTTPDTRTQTPHRPTRPTQPRQQTSTVTYIDKDNDNVGQSGKIW